MVLPLRAARAGLAALLALAGAECGAARADELRLSLREARRSGVELEIEEPLGARFVFWPVEAVSSGGRTVLVTPEQVGPVVAHPDGTLAFQVSGTHGDAVQVRVGLRPEGDVLRAVYQLTNRSREPRHVTVAPCLQLPAELFGVEGWARARHVFAVTPAGLRWLADLRQSRGRRQSPADPDPARSPWSQHLLPVGVTPAVARGTGLELFGVAEEPAAAAVIGFAAPGSALRVAVAATTNGGVTYSLLNCLHAAVAALLEPGETREIAWSAWFQRGSFESLRARLAADLRIPLPADAAFLSPEARATPLELPVTYGSVDVAPGVASLTLPLRIPEVRGRPVALSLDVALEPPGEEVSIEASLSGPEPVARTAAAPSHGTWRRLVLPLSQAPPAPARLEIALRGLRAPARLSLDGLTLHAIPWAPEVD